MFNSSFKICFLSIERCSAKYMQFLFKAWKTAILSQVKVLIKGVEQLIGCTNSDFCYNLAQLFVDMLDMYVISPL